MLTVEGKEDFNPTTSVQSESSSESGRTPSPSSLLSADRARNFLGTLYRVSKNPLRATLALMIAGGAFIDNLQNVFVSAETIGTPTPTPLSKITPEGKAPSQRALESFTEAISPPPNPIYFSYPGPDTDPRLIGHEWIRYHSRGIEPNSPDRAIDSIQDKDTGTGAILATIQPDESRRPETSRGTGVRISTEGMLADESIGSGYLATEVFVDNVGFPDIEVVKRVNYPNDFSERQVIRIPNRGTYGDGFKSFYFVVQGAVKNIYAEIQHSLYPEDDGLWACRTDAGSGYIVGDCVKVAEPATVTPTPPEPSATPTGTPTEVPPTNTPTGTATQEATASPSPTATQVVYKKAFLPMVIRFQTFYRRVKGFIKRKKKESSATEPQD